MSENQPNWLKSIQNGQLGEARAKALLLNRFWVLERSVDTESADYLIQRREFKINNSCLGIVQVKYLREINRPLYITKEDVVGEDSIPRKDFFLLVFTGSEDNFDIYFFDSEDISSFELSVINNTLKYHIPSKDLSSGNYKVSPVIILNRMESLLTHADYLKNRKFVLSKFSNENIDITAIMPEYNEPIDNWWGNIPVEFTKIKKSAMDFMKELDDMYSEIRDIANETSPMEAMIKAEVIKKKFKQGYYSGWGIEIANNLFNENLYYTCQLHKEKIDQLKKDRLFNNFLKIRDTLKSEVFSYLSCNLPIDSNTVHVLNIEFNLRSSQIKINQSLVKASIYFNVSDDLDTFGHVKVINYKGINEIAANTFEYYWLAGRTSTKDKTSSKLENFYSDLDLPIFWQCMDKIYEMYN